LPMAQRLKAAMRAGLFYAGWYPRLFVPVPALGNLKVKVHRVLARHLRYAVRTSRRLARSLFHAMVRFGPKLERQQLVLGRLVDIGTELFAIAATCSHAHSLLARTPDESGKRDLLQLVGCVCDMARLR